VVVGHPSSYCCSGSIAYAYLLLGTPPVSALWFVLCQSAVASSCRILDCRSIIYLLAVTSSSLLVERIFLLQWQLPHLHWLILFLLLNYRWQMEEALLLLVQLFFLLQWRHLHLGWKVLFLLLVLVPLFFLFHGRLPHHCWSATSSLWRLQSYYHLYCNHHCKLNTGPLN